NGPLLFFTINGQGPGALLHVPAETKTLQVRAEARSLLPFERLEVIHDGAVVAEQKATGAPATATLEIDVPVLESGWWAARCWGDHDMEASICPQPASAHTSPIYIDFAGKPLMPQLDAL